MTMELQSLIREARTTLGSDACRAGRHQWTSEGEGCRGCPHDITDDCGQGVYRCSVCGQHDYGETGGPGHNDCERFCQHRPERTLAIMQARRDPFDLARTPFNSNANLYHHMLLRALRRQPTRRLP